MELGATAILWRQRRKLALGLALLLVDRAAGLVLPLAPKVLLDEVVAHRRTALLPLLAAAVVLAALVQGAASFAIGRVLGLSAERVVLDLRRRLMAHVTSLPAAELDRTQSGALLSRIMDDAAAMQNLVGAQVARWTSNAVTALVALCALLVLDWRMTLVALGLAVLPGLALDRAFRTLRPLYRARADLRAEVAGRLMQTLAGLRVVKAYAAERRERLVFTRGLHRLHRVVAQTTNRRGVFGAVSSVVSASVIAVVVLMGGSAILSGRMTVGGFASYVAFALMFAAPLVDLPDIATRVAETLADLERVRELLALPRERAEGEPLATVESIAFEGVSFAYRAGVPVLEDVTFQAVRGGTTAIVGPSGAGKSTLLSLLLAFHRPSRGRILAGDRDLVGVRDWRRHLAVVLQDDFLFDGTLAENVALGRPNATRAEIEAAVRAAHLADVVRALPQGLETRVGERGLVLSGGQRQRVSIARALLKDAPVLLLDEATSNLDAESEAAVRSALATLARGRTVIVVAHRLATVRAADRIVVLDAGRVVQVGTHDELLARGGRYRELHDAAVVR